MPFADQPKPARCSGECDCTMCGVDTLCNCERFPPLTPETTARSSQYAVPGAPCTVEPQPHEGEQRVCV